ncbi:MAG TPA: regulatory protein RecX [Thermoanaerobaculia bacterium]
MRSRGREELRRDLRRRGFSAAAADGALGRLVSQGWLQDLPAARSFVRARAPRYGRLRIARELSARGFDAETIRRALAEEGDRENDALAKEFRRLWRSCGKLPEPRRRRKVRGALLRRGFAQAAISEMIGDSNEIDGDSGEIP